MFEVRVEKTIACAHRLFDYNGPCESLHGHNYRIEVAYTGTELDRFGMLVEPRNPAAFASAMDQVSVLRERFPAEMLRQRAGDFSYAACASRYMALFKALVPHPAAAAGA